MRGYFLQIVKRRIAKILIITALVVAVLLAAGGWFANRWLQSSAGLATIEKKLSEALHMPVKIESPGFSAWSGVSTDKITVSGPGGVIFEAAGISASHRFSSLLRGQIGLVEVRIREPRVRLYQDAAGKWGLQRTTAAPPPNAPALPPAVLPVVPQPAVPPPAASGPAKHPPVSIGKVIVERGTFEMFDKMNAPFATVSGVNVTMRDVTESAFTGTITVDRATMHGWAAIEHLSGNVTHSGQAFAISNLTATTGGGAITGEANYTLGATAAATLKLVGVDLDRATQEGGMKGQKISGTVNGDAQFAGLGADKRLMTGRGTLSLKGGDCSQFDVLRQIGDVLRVTMLAKFQIGDAAANFQIANEQVTLAPMEIATPPIGLTLTGPITFDGTLNLIAFMSAPADEIAAQPLLAANFSPPDARNRRSVQFHITGPMKKPRQDLADALTGTKNHREQNIIGGASIIGALIGKKNPKLMQKLAPALELVKPTLDRVLPGAPPAPEPR